jgi:hypothetical protein
MATLTYYCGNYGYARKYDHSTSTWSNASIANVDTLYDIMAFPGNSIRVIAVGRHTTPGTASVWFSSNGGSTWTPSNIVGPGSIPTVIYEVWVQSATFVYAVGQDEVTGNPVILRSINGGATFESRTLPSTASTQSPAMAVHFPTPNLGVVAIGNKVYYTTDSTNTWISTNFDLPIAINGQNCVLIKGIHIAQQGSGSYRITVLADQGISQSLDSGVNFLTRHDYGIRIGEHLTWFGDSNFWATDLNGGILFSETYGTTWGIASPTVLFSPDNVRGAHFYKIVTSTPSPVTEFLGFLCTNFNGTPPGLHYSITTQNTSDIPLTFPANLAPTAIADAPQIADPEVPEPEFYAVWTEYENTLCVRLKECNGTREVIIKDIYNVGTNTLLSSYGVGASVTINWSGGNSVSPCLAVSDYLPSICWTIEEIIQDCDMEAICEEVIP